ncbi:hypothetical protein [Noviherbaspirillum malthae]|uniref:hypothetical protein n=1 Tax=Noviherbaspirillum malthae TaxID=1260987 RepID=UPI00188EA57E|nr:hypothetical protein [Noviherbaspirillum malthae]
MVFIKSKSENPSLGIDRSLEQAASVMPGVLDRAMAARQSERSGEPPVEMVEDTAFRFLEEPPLVWARVSRDGSAPAAAHPDQGEKPMKRARLFGFMYEITVTFFNIVVWGLLALFALLTLIYG